MVFQHDEIGPQQRVKYYVLNDVSITKDENAPGPDKNVIHLQLNKRSTNTESD